MRKLSCKAFSLVEVTLALGITAFCLVSLLGLLPVGLNVNRNSVEQTAAASIAGTVVADIRTQAVNNARMPSSATAGTSSQYGFDLTKTTIQTIYINADGTFTAVGTTPAPATALFRVSLVFTPPAQAATATPLRILVTWPAQAGNAASTAMPNLANVSGSYDALTAVDLTR